MSIKINIIILWSRLWLQNIDFPDYKGLTMSIYTVFHCDVDFSNESDLFFTYATCRSEFRNPITHNTLEGHYENCMLRSEY